MNRVLWIRHGTSLDGLCRPHAHARPETPLTLRGVAEIATAARDLRDRNIRPDLILTSPLPRATTSAAILAEILGATLAPPDPLYAEWRAPDCVLGIGQDDYPREYQAWRDERFRHPESALPGGESLAALQRRARSAASLSQDQTGPHSLTLIVSHRVFIGAVAASATDARSPQGTFRTARNFSLGPAAIWPL
ncbi:histidine phosphatase family protein [Micromonospora sp. NPDC049559]|uniref:histidine phosphatase family protein n=1 Tax=Micromonospora sp. NPDC049559 TaxID=3155923 RepID=UPI0034162F52